MRPIKNIQEGDDYAWTLHPTPGKLREGKPVRVVTEGGPLAVKMRDGQLLGVYTEGSFRRVNDRHQRRPAGLSGRQRRIERKLLRRMHNEIERLQSQPVVASRYHRHNARADRGVAQVLQLLKRQATPPAAQ